MTTLSFETNDGPLAVAIMSLTIAGWTGRDPKAVQHHIDELAAIGVPSPSTVPLYYKVSPSLLCQTDELVLLGEETSGEAEPFLLRARGKLWLGVASDHTDRGLEATSVAHSKQVCPKPVAEALWDFDSLSQRTDDLQLSSWIEEAGQRKSYQKGTLALMRPLTELLAGNPLQEDGEAMLCGTLPAIGGVRPASRFGMALHDDAGGRSIATDYRIVTVPVVA